MKRFLAEDGAALVNAVWASGEPLVTSWVSFAEASAAIGAARRSRRLSRTVAADAARALEADWDAVMPIVVARAVAVRGGALAVRHGLRSLDAIQLASALLLRTIDPLVLTFDRGLADAARREGLLVVGS